jgi:predicted ATP-grasp superfamily ATP-dependent carboligase
VEFKEQYQVKISNRFAALKSLDINVMMWTSIGLGKVSGENTKASATECLI